MPLINDIGFNGLNRRSIVEALKVMQSGLAPGRGLEPSIQIAIKYLTDVGTPDVTSNPSVNTGGPNPSKGARTP